MVLAIIYFVVVFALLILVGFVIERDSDDESEFPSYAAMALLWPVLTPIVLLLLVSYGPRLARPPDRSHSLETSPARGITPQKQRGGVVMAASSSPEWETVCCGAVKIIRRLTDEATQLPVNEHTLRLVTQLQGILSFWEELTAMVESQTPPEVSNVH